MDTKAFVGFGVKGYKSFNSDEMAFFFFNSTINNIIGPNNSGKSNALKFMSGLIKPVKPDLNYNRFPGMAISELTSPVTQFVNSSRPWGSEQHLVFALGLDASHPQVEEKLQKLVSDPVFSKLIKSKQFYHSDTNTVWFQYEVLPKFNQLALHISKEQLDKALADIGDGKNPKTFRNDCANRLRKLYPTAQWDVDDPMFAVWANVVVESIKPFNFVPNIEWIASRRSIGDSGSQTATNNIVASNPGLGLARKLSAINNPPQNKIKQYRAVKRNLLAFLKDVTGEDVVDINIPDGTQTIQLIDSKDEAKDIMSLGDGIVEVVMYAFVSTITNDSIICIDEPELHLHPTLQKRFINYLLTKTTNKYLLATHSQGIVDFQNCTITKTACIDGASTTSLVPSVAELADLLHTLGSRPSDLMQSNYIIWVEGPADRIFVNGWLSEISPALIEGVHYSVLFYGGSTLNSFSLEDSIDDVISMLRINRKAAIIIDSDIKAEGKEINATKQRIVDEAKTLGIKCWVTAGYTIENFIPADVMFEAITETHSDKARKSWIPNDSQYLSPYDGIVNCKKVDAAKLVLLKLGIKDLLYDGAEWVKNIASEITKVNQI